MKPGYAQKRVMIFAFVTALVFAVHPLQVEAVAWASASKIVMYAFFVVLACCAYLKYTDSGSFLSLSVVMLLYLVAFACKEQAIIFPLNLVVLDYALGRFKKQNMGRGMLFSKVVLEKIPFFAVALLLWYFSYQNNLGGFQSPAYPFSQRIFIGAHSFVMYIYRFLAPVKLYYYYFYPMAPGDAVPAAYGIYLLLSLLVFIFFIYHFRHKNKVLATGFLFFLVNILLVLHVLPMPRGYATADRFMYLGITGCTLSLCWIVQYVWSKYQKLRGLLLSTITVFLVLIALHSFFRVARWKDSTALKKEVKELLENRKKNDINTNSNIQNR